MMIAIAPTPPLKGQAAIDFITEISKKKKVTPAEKAKVKEGVMRIKALLTFNF